MTKHLPDLSACPVCGSRPDVGECEPWDTRKYGMPAWYACCYRAGRDEHCVAANGDNHRDVIEEWNKTVAAYRHSPASC